MRVPLSLKNSNAELICSPTENHLVLVRLREGQSANQIENKLSEAGLLVKAETLLTSNDNVSYSVLRLSSLDPTTRALNEDDMFTVGLTLGEFINSSMDSKAINSVSDVIKELVEALPLFSEDWLPAAEITQNYDPDLIMKAMIYGSV